jgi:hypothetical protein
LGKTVEKKRKELLKKKAGPSLYDRTKLLENPKVKYTREQLDEIFKLIDEDLHAQEIAEKVNITARQIKLIRQIYKKGDEEDLERLLSCKYYISRILAKMKLKKEKIKIANKTLYSKYTPAKNSPRHNYNKEDN